MARLVRTGVAAAVGLIAALAFAAAALAHVEVAANPDTAGATNAVLTFSAEAENPKAGIAAVEIVLPDGITKTDVALDKAPAGWKLTPTSNGYKVAGTPLKQGVDAVHSVIVTRLPNVSTLVFKALVTYTDGTVDRWIDTKSASNPNPDHPAAVLMLNPAPGSTTADVITTAPTTPPAAVGPTASPTANSPTSGSGNGDWIWWVVAAVVVIGAAGFALIRRRANQS